MWTNHKLDKYINAVCDTIRKAKTKIFNKRINAKFKDARQFHEALRSSNNIDHCNIDPSLLNYIFLNGNSEKHFDIVNTGINGISKKSLRFFIG